MNDYSNYIALIAFSLASIAYLIAFPQTSGWRAATERAAHYFFGAALTALWLAILSPPGSALNAALSGATNLDSDIWLQGAMTSSLLTAVIATLAMVAHVVFHIKLAPAMIAPLATLILLLQFFVAPTAISEVPPLTSWTNSLRAFHIGTAIIGQAFAVIAAVGAVFYLWQQQLLKKKLLNQIPSRLPAIDRLQKMLHISLWLAFILITASLVSGAIYTKDFTSSDSLRLEFKVLWSVLVWLLYLIILMTKNVFGRTTKFVSKLTLLSFCVLVCSYFGIGFFRHFSG